MFDAYVRCLGADCEHRGEGEEGEEEGEGDEERDEEGDDEVMRRGRVSRGGRGGGG